MKNIAYLSLVLFSPITYAQVVCLPPQAFKASEYIFSYNNRNFNFEAKSRTSGAYCKIPLPISPNILSVYFDGTHMKFDSDALPANTATRMLNSFMSKASVYLVKNNYKYPISSYPAAVFKVVGNESVYNQGMSREMVYSNVEESPLYINRNSTGYIYSFFQERASTLDKTNHNSEFVLLELEDHQQ